MHGDNEPNGTDRHPVDGTSLWLPAKGKQITFTLNFRNTCMLHAKSIKHRGWTLTNDGTMSPSTATSSTQMEYAQKGNLLGKTANMSSVVIVFP